MRKLLPVVMLLGVGGCFGSDIPAYVCTEANPGCPEGETCNFNKQQCVPKGSQLDASVDGPVTDTGKETAPDLVVPDVARDMSPDAPVPDVAVDAPLPDVAVDAPLPDVAVDAPLPDVSAPDQAIPVPDLPIPDKLVPDKLASDQTIQPDSGTTVCSMIEHSVGGNGKATGGSPLDVLALGQGKYLVTWDNSKGSGVSMYGRIYKDCGVPVTAEFMLNSNTSTKKSGPEAALLSSGGFVVAWDSDTQDGSDHGVFGQIFDASGKKVGGEFRLNQATSGSQADPSIVGLPSGEFFACYQGPDGSHTGVYCRHFSSTGAAKSNEYRVNTVKTGRQGSPEVVRLASGALYVLFHSQETGSFAIHGRKVTTTGSSLGTEFVVNTHAATSTTFKYNPQASVLSGGGFVAAWESNGQDGSGWGIAGQHYSATGAKAGKEFVLNDQTSQDQQYSTLVPLSNSIYVGCWNGAPNDSSHCRYFDETSGPVGAQFTVPLTTTGKQHRVAAALVDSKNWVAAWKHDPTNSGTYEVRFRVMTAPQNNWVTIKAGTFQMGSPDGTGTQPKENCRATNETQLKVTLTRDFEMQTTEVTQDQFYAVMGYKPWKFTSCGGTCPVEQVTWDEAAAYTNALSSKAGLTACYSCTGIGTSVKCQETSATKGKGIYTCLGYRLPTEAEWEYAYRAGTTTAFYNGGISSCKGKDPNLDKIGWYDQNSSTTMHPAGKKTANAWGLSDMAGNVWEWCHDWLTTYPKTSVIDPVGATGSLRVRRGGSWGDAADRARAAYRDSVGPGGRSSYLGIRLVRSLPPKTKWVTIKAGTFQMGSPSSPAEPCQNTDETQHKVTLTHDFEIAATETTQAQFSSLMGYNSSNFSSCGPSCPAENINWYEAAAYANALSKQAGKTECYKCSNSGTAVICAEALAYAGSKIYTCPGYL